MFSYHDDGCPEIDEYDREHDKHRSQDAEQRQHQIEPEREVLLPERERDPTRVVRQTLCGELVADLTDPLQKNHELLLRRVVIIYIHVYSWQRVV